ncbi:hypothetical protein [Curtobacterium sp. USHLN213]|uniref:hypothetical protein n=1 Tax=Curtobacterium sp. USHLN213 TaxID=3081255 RepID=UPI00301A99A6
MSNISWMRIADSNWPRPEMERDEEVSVSWKLRYAPESLTREEQLYAASVMNSYGYLLVDTTNARTAQVKREAKTWLREEA